jgi:hypothetical protein
MRWWRYYYPFLNSPVRIMHRAERTQDGQFYRAAMYCPLDTLAWNGIRHIREKMKCPTESAGPRTD